jgi:hypothetical protein
LLKLKGTNLILDRSVSFKKCIKNLTQAWWHTLVISALRRLTQENCTFEASMSGLYNKTLNQNTKKSQVPKAHTYNSSYLGGWDLEDGGLRLARANSLWDPIPKKTKQYVQRGVTQAVECLLCKHKAQSSKTSPIKKEKKMYEDS